MEQYENIKIRSISPSLLQSLSPTRFTSRLSNYQKTRKKIASISKTVFKDETDQHPILSLEKDVLRGRGNAKKEKRTLKTKHNLNLSPLESYLHTEHKTSNEGTQIIKLPKLRFGQHKTYNEEEIFVDKHFVNEYSKPEQIKELNNLSRKFKLGERIKSKRNHSQNNSFTVKNDSNDVYQTDSGVLVCLKEKEVIKSYECDKDKYIIKHHYVYQTFRDIEKAIQEKLSKKNSLNQIKIKNEMVNRLYSPAKVDPSQLDRQVTSKYSVLFSDS
jgi:hypothetical protein